MRSRPLPCPALVVFAFALATTSASPAADWALPDKTPGDRQLRDYFEAETERLADAASKTVESPEAWQQSKAESRAQLLEMLGLDPLPEKTDLKPVVTGTLEHGNVVVEKLHFQSRPGLYVTANLYRPKNVTQSLPAILYVCGHGQVKKDGISYGNKVHYQHHGYWFAQHGYVCLVIDTLQLGEIEGIHHGTYRYDRWWWLNRGYTPAGVEAWNCVRALDYLQSRDDVDDAKLGVTGRSGGGAYSWWISAIDDRIQCSIPTAGITDLRDHVVDGCVEGHCDCMYMVNTYRWDYPQLAAMVAPRPMLLTNTDTDPIFPLDGVVRIFEHTRKAYQHEKAAPALGLNITAGGHIDTQEQQVHTLRWFNRHLKGEEPLITDAAEKHFTPEQLKVFDTLPTDEVNTKIDETFVPEAGEPRVPSDLAAWRQMSHDWKQQLLAKSFRAWPKDEEPAKAEHGRGQFTGEIAAHEYELSSHNRAGEMGPSVFAVHRENLKQAERVVVHVLDQDGWDEAQQWWRYAFQSPLKGEKQAAIDWNQWSKWSDNDLRKSSELHVFVAPRCIGPTAVSADAKKQVQIDRRYYLLGQTLDGMQAYDIRRALQAVSVGLPEVPKCDAAPIELRASGRMGVNTIYASLFEPAVDQLTLTDLPSNHREGPYYLNVSRVMEVPQAVAMAAERSTVELRGANAADWKYPRAVEEKLGWQDRLKLETK